MRILAKLTNSFPLGDLEEILFIERDIFVRSYGLDKYEQLKSKLNDYNGSPVWDGSSVEGTVYFYEGMYWKAKTDSNAIPGGNDSDWELPEKFDGECFNELWNGSLGFLLAYNVARDSVVPSSLKMSASGVVVRDGRDFQAVGGTELNTRLKDYDAKIARLWNLFKIDFEKCFAVAPINKRMRGSRYRAI